MLDFLQVLILIATFVIVNVILILFASFGFNLYIKDVVKFMTESKCANFDSHINVWFLLISIVAISLVFIFNILCIGHLLIELGGVR